MFRRHIFVGCGDRCGVQKKPRHDQDAYFSETHDWVSSGRCR
jgi:hypothetical protein